MFEFDLQLFDDDATETSAVETSSEESTETSSEETSEQELPEEFEGLEEYKEDILKDISEMEKSQTQQENSYETSSPSQVDEVAALKAQIDEYKKQFGELPQSQPQQQPQQQPKQTQQQIPQVQIPQLQLTPEVSAKIKDAIKQEAMRISGMSEDDANAVDEYGDEDDPNYLRWQQANKIAEGNVYNAIRQAQQQQAIQQQVFLQRHNEAVQTFNEFYQKAVAEKDFNEIVQFAKGEYFNSLPKPVQDVVFDSYVRIEKNVASPAEALLVQQFFDQARTSYRNKLKTTPRKQVSGVSKSFPKIDQLNGANGNLSGGVSSHDLEKLMNEDFDTFEKKFGKYFK